MRIVKVELLTEHLAEQKEFYIKKLGLTLIESSAHSFSIQAGASQIVFVEAKGGAPSPYYHFAFNIPENQLAAAKAWLGPRTSLLPIQNSDEIFFEDWNAHAVYFYDPAGNIVEFIARHNLANRSEIGFGSHSILSVSEIGLPVEQIQPVYQQLKQGLQLELWRGNGLEFAAIGDEEGLFIVTTLERGWLSEDRPAQINPTIVTLQGETETQLNLKDIPYRVIVSKEV